jgi:Domain of unknown function (DUF4864)
MASAIGGLAAAMLLASLAAPSRDPVPDPKYSAADVVGIVLHALQHNDDPAPDHGIAVTFAFASPANRQATGPLDRFTLLVKDPEYRTMIRARSMHRGPLDVMGAHARQRVTVVGAGGETRVFIFLLSKQQGGPYNGCWMTDAVTREPEPTLPPGVTAT